MFQERSYFIAEDNGFYLGCKFEFIDLNNAKMQCLITKHSFQNKIGYPMLKYFFHLTDCVLIEDHQCRVMTQNEF